jgi:hypothetical protein
MSRLQATLLGGLFIGVLSILPIVNLLNLCCCLWVVTGGVLTVWLRQQGGVVLDGTEAALVGLGAGVVGGLITTLLSLAMFSLVGDMSALFDRISEQLPPDLRDQMLSLESRPGIMLFSSLISIPVYAVFSMLGALVGLLLFRKPQPPPPVQV